MKSLMNFIFPVLFLLLIVGPGLEALAQDQNDVVIMLNGERKEGKVTGVNESSIKFVHKGEDLEYTLNNDDINKIVFASGRTQVINEASSAAASVTTTGMPESSPAERKGKLAVLPFEYITNDESIQVDAMRTRMQSDCVNSLRDNTASLDMQDPMTTNSILSQNNIDPGNVRTISPKDMANLLGVEFVVYGSYDLQFEGTMTTGSSVTTYKDKEEKKKNDDDKKTKSSGSAITTNNSNTIANYDARLDLAIYNDQGNNVYSDSRKPFKAGPDSYHGTIDYLVKRTPFGSKGK